MSAMTDAYVLARRNFDQARAARDRLIEYISGVANQMKTNPERFSFANTQGGYPAEVAMTRNSVSVNADEWPSVPHIEQIFIAHYSAKGAMLDAWRAVPQEDRNAFQPPPVGW